MWATKKLHEVCDIQSGLWKGKKEPFTNALVLRNTNFTSSGRLDYSNVVELEVETKQLMKREVVKDDIILEKSGGGDKTPVGRVCIHNATSDVPFSLSNFTARLRVKNRELLDAHFLHRFLYFLYISGKTEPMQRHSTGIRNLQLSQYKNIDIPLPPLAEQKRIVERLDKAFSEIDKAIATAEAKEGEVERLKAATLSAMLNRGSQSGESITEDEEDSVMWKTVRLGDVCEIQPKKAQVKAKLAKEDEVSFVPMDDLAIGQLYPIITTKRRLKDVYSSYTYFEDDDILLAKITPCFENGKLGVARNLANGVGFGSSEYLVIRCREQVLAEYLYYHLSQSGFRAEGKKHMRGAVGHKRVPRDFVENYTFQLPPLAEQKRIVERLDKAFAEIESVSAKTQSSVENYAALKAAVLKQELTPSETI